MSKRSKADMKAMILVAGRGSRLGALTRDLPKPLLPVCNRPLILHTIDRLKDVGITEIIVNPCYQGEKVVHLLGDGKEFGVSITYRHERHPAGTAGAVRAISGCLQNEPLMVVYGDNWLGMDLLPFILHHNVSCADCTLMTSIPEDRSQCGMVEEDEQGRVTRFVEKPAAPFCSASEWGFAGVMIMERPLLRRIPAGMPLDFGFSVFPYWISLGLKICTYRIQSTCIVDIGTSAGYLSANILALSFQRSEEDPLTRNQVDPSAQISPYAVLHSPVMIGAESVIDAGAVIGPHTVIGRECQVAGRVARSVLWNGAKIDSHEEIHDRICTARFQVSTHSLNT
jgi:NDP-sugar pyrophosphorylase family protein